MIARGRREHAVELGAALRALQQRSGRTLRALEEQVRISDSSLSRYFRGDTVPPWPVVRDLCRALGADPFAYRTLWEAAERGPAGPPPPADAPAPSQAPLPPPAEEPAPALPHPAEEPAPRAAAPVWRRRPRALLAGRAVAAATGALGGLTAGFLLALLVLPTAPTGSSGHGTAAEGHVPTRATSAGAPERSGAARTFVSRATGYCLDSSLDHGLRSYPCNGMSYQRWDVLPGADGTHRLRNHATGLCLEDSGTAVRARPCDGPAAQAWTFTEREDEAVRLQNASTGHCLDESTAGLRALACAAGRQQEWG